EIQYAQGVDFDDSNASLGATSVQGAIDELADKRVSSDPGNLITIGNDGGAYFDSTIKPIRIVNMDYPIAIPDYTIILENGGSLNTITLPSPGTPTVGKIYIIRNNSGNNVNIEVNGTPPTPFTILTGNEALWVQTDGNNWYQIN